MKRIAMLSVHTCPLGHLGTRDTGGMNVYVRELSRELGRAGMGVDVFTRYRNCDHPCEVELGDGARLVHLGAGEAPELSKYDLYEYLPEFAGNVVNYQQTNGLSYEFIHSHYWLSGWVGELLKACWNVPHLTTFHTLGRVKNLDRSLEPEPQIRLETEDRVARVADRVLALTEAEKSLLGSLYGVPAGKVSVIPGGIDSSVFRPLDRAQARRALETPEGPLVLYVGRMEPLKGVDVLVRALASMKTKASCIAVGGDANDDGQVAKLRDLATACGLERRVSFLGSVEHELLPRYYAAADVTVVPSRYESFGLVALESIACGTPVVASDAGGLPTIVRNGENGLLVAGNDPSAFARGIDSVLADAGLRKALSLKAVTSAQQFAWPRVRAQVIELYREMALAGAAV